MKMHEIEIERRKLLLGGLAAFGGMQLVSSQARGAVRLFASVPSYAGQMLETLVLVQMAGGNDGLSTVVPFGDDKYNGARTTTRITEKEVLALDEYRGLHPRLKGLERHYKEGRMAIVEGCGYPTPNRSHFESFEIWHTADLRGRSAGEGWIGRLCRQCWAAEADPNRVVHVGGSLPYSLHSTKHPAACLSIPEAYRWVGDPRDLDVVCDTEAPEPKAPVKKKTSLEFLRDVQRDAQASSAQVRLAAARYKPKAEYPREAFSGALRTSAALIQGRVGSRILSVELGGFDTHNDQRNRHDNQMQRMNDGLTAFLDDLSGTEAGKSTLVVVFSEFGRRVAENGSRGTDHGTAAPMFLLGEPVKGGLYGKHPALDELDKGDLVFTTDFRSVYASVVETWFKADSAKVLGSKHATLPLFVA